MYLVLQLVPTVTLTDIILLLLLLVFVIALIASAIKIVPEFVRIVVFRLGRFIGVRGPGVVFIIPIIDRILRIDLRERFLEVSRQTCITKDNAPVDIDFLIYYKVFDASQSVIQVQNFEGASVGLATTTLRAVVGDIPLDELLARREQINNILRAKLDEITERWGVKITSVEIREITPPREVQDAMVKQMAAERNRRAMVTEADGRRESAILVAEGEKQSAILKAEGDRQAAILRAEGAARALETIYGAARVVDYKTMALQYLDAMKALGASPASKFILPLELTSLIAPVKRWLGSEEEK